MMPPPAPRIEILESGPVRHRLPARGRRQLTVAGIALGVAAGVVVAATMGTEAPPLDPPTAFVESWIEAWNDRDALLVSSMTCQYVGAFIPAGVIEDLLDAVPPGRPVLADHTIEGTEPAEAYGRAGTKVHVSHGVSAAGKRGESTVFVQAREDGSMCIGGFSPW